MRDSIWNAILAYLDRGMKDLRPTTQKHYRNTGLRMLHHFGHYQLEELKPTHCKQFLNWMRDTARATTGNRQAAFMSSVYEFALGEGWCEYNPWRGMRRNKERPARVYVEHEQLIATIDRAPPQLMPLFAVGYLTGMRQTDLRLLEKRNLVGDRIEWTESKTGKFNEKPISPTIRKFLNAAAAHACAVADQHEARGRLGQADLVRRQPYVFLTKRGFAWTENGLASALQRFQAGFTFRSLRPKAQTDSPDKNILGHTGQLLERYTRRRKLDVVK